MVSLKVFLELIRPVNCIMAAIAVLVGYCLALGFFAFNEPVLLAMISAFLICGAGQAINDYFDRKVDAHLKRSRPIPSKRISTRTVKWFVLALFVVGILAGAFAGWLLFGIALIVSLLLFLYSASMRSFKFIGNWLVAAFIALTYFYGAAIVGAYSVVVWLALCAGLSNAGREITKDLEDQKMDKGFKKTLPLVAGNKFSKALASIAYFAAIVFSPMPFLLGATQSIAFLAVVLLADLCFIAVIALLLRNRFPASQKYAKLSMIVALLAYVLIILRV